MSLLGEKVIDFGQHNNHGTGTQRLMAKAAMRASLSMRYNVSYTIWQCTPMVRADSGINSIEDLVGKRIMPASAGGRDNRSMEDIVSSSWHRGQG